MKTIKHLFNSIKEWTGTILTYAKTFFMSATAKNNEILALRSQLALFQVQIDNKKIPKPQITQPFRQLWVVLSKFFTNWQDCLMLVKPETVIKWHRTAFKVHWNKISRKRGRPALSAKTIALIKKIHKENPTLSVEKIYEQLVLLNVTDATSPNAIKKYIKKPGKPPTEKRLQSWINFLKNHSDKTWAMDFFTIPTLYFKNLYVLIIINHGNRKIEQFGVTTNPNTEWVKQQMKNATPYDHKPKYLIHDNDPVFVSKDFQDFLTASGIKSKKTAIRSPWQNPIAERAVGIIRQELLNNIIPLNEGHLQKLLHEYIHSYYNTHRTHQGINCKTPILSPEYAPTHSSKFRW